MDLQTIIVPLWSANVFKWAFWGAILGYLGQCFDRYIYIYIYRICIYIYKYIYRSTWIDTVACLKGPYILPETNSQRTRKWDGWNTIVLFPLGIWPFLRCELLVSGWVYTVHIIPYESMFVCWSRLFVCYLETFLDCHLGRWLFETHWLIWTFPVNKYTSLGKFETMTFVICWTPQNWWRWFVCFSYLTSFFSNLMATQKTLNRV